MSEERAQIRVSQVSPVEITFQRVYNVSRGLGFCLQRIEALSLSIPAPDALVRVLGHLCACVSQAPLPLAAGQQRPELQGWGTRKQSGVPHIPERLRGTARGCGVRPSARRWVEHVYGGQ